MNAPPFPTNPSVGEWFGNWTWNGARWVCNPSTGVRQITTVFTASGPYMPSPGLVSLIVECIGGGGGGGGAATDTTTEVMSGGGGGSGGYSRKTLAASLVLGGVNVTVGAGGTPALASTVAGNGGATQFGALCVANGGAGGVGADPGVVGGTGGAGAIPGVGDVTIPGNAGDTGGWNVLGASGVVLSASTPMGGSMWGGVSSTYAAPGGGPVTGPNGAANTGAGGGGGVVNQELGIGAYGGTGGSGLCIVTELCWADGDDVCVNPINVDARVAVTHVPWQGPGPCPPGWGGPGGPYVGYDGED